MLVLFPVVPGMDRGPVPHGLRSMRKSFSLPLPSHLRNERSGTSRIARAMDTEPKRTPLREQLLKLIAHVETKDRQIVALRRSGRVDQAKVAEAIRNDAVAKAQLVADQLAKGKVYDGEQRPSVTYRLEEVLNGTTIRIVGSYPSRKAAERVAERIFEPTCAPKSGDMWGLLIVRD